MATDEEIAAALAEVSDEEIARALQEESDRNPVAKPAVAPARADFQWTTTLPSEFLPGQQTPIPPPARESRGIVPEQRFAPALQDLNRDPLGPRTPEMRPAPPPVSAGRLSPQRSAELMGTPMPAQKPIDRALEPFLRPVAGAVAGTGQILSDAAQIMASGGNPLNMPKPLFSAKTYLRDLEAKGVFGEADYWDRFSQKVGEIAPMLGIMGGTTAALTRAGVAPFLAQQAGMGLVAATQTAADAQRQNRTMSGDETLAMTIDNVVTYPLFAGAFGEATKGLLANVKYSKQLTPIVSAAVVGAGFEGLPDPGPGGSRLENAAAGATAFALDAALRHHFPDLTRARTKRGAKQQTTIAADALAAEAGRKSASDAQNAATQAKINANAAYARAEAYAYNYRALNEMAAFKMGDPATAKQYGVTPEQIVAETGVDPVRARSLANAVNGKVPSEKLRETRVQLINERIVDDARTQGGEKLAQEMRFKLGMMDPLESRRYRVDVVQGGTQAELEYRAQQDKRKLSKLKEQARQALSDEHVDRIMAGTPEGQQRLAAREQEAQQREAKARDLSEGIKQQRLIDQGKAEREARTKAEVEAARVKFEQAAKERDQATLARKADLDVAAMESDLAPPLEGASPAEQLKAEIQAREFGPKFKGGPPPPVGRQEPPPPGDRAATKYRKTGPPTSLPTAERAAESALTPERPRKPNKKKAQKALDETVRRLKPTTVKGPLREPPSPPPPPPSGGGTPLRVAPKQPERGEFGKVRAAFKGRGESPPPVKAAAPPEPPKAPPAAAADRVQAQKDVAADWPQAIGMSGGLEIKGPTPNVESIETTLGSDWHEVRGMRQVPLSEFSLSGKSYSVSETKRIADLAAQIKENGYIKPLIVVIEPDGSPYILEGGHRAEALFLLGKKEFPAHVIIDTNAPPPVAAEQPKPEAPPVEKKVPPPVPKPADFPIPANFERQAQIEAAYKTFADARGEAEKLRRNYVKALKRAGVPGTDSFAYAEEADIRHRKAADAEREAKKRYDDLQSAKPPEKPAPPPIAPPKAPPVLVESRPAERATVPPPTVERPVVVPPSAAPKVDTPTQAAAKIEGQVEREVQTGRAHGGGKQIRERIVDTLEGELRDLLQSDGKHEVRATTKQEGMSHGFLDGEHVLSVNRYGYFSDPSGSEMSVYSPGSRGASKSIEGFRDMNPDQKKLAVLRAVWNLPATEPYADGKNKLRMRIPGDGTFTLPHTPRAIDGLIEKIGGSAADVWTDVAKKFENSIGPDKPKYEPETPEPETPSEVSQRVQFENSKRYEDVGKGWKKGAESIYKSPEKEGGKPGREDVIGFIDPSGTFIIHNAVDGPKNSWTVTHIASGISVGHAFSKSDAQLVSARLLDIPNSNWGFTSLAQFEKEVKNVVSKEAGQIISGIREGDQYRATERQIEEAAQPAPPDAATRPAGDVQADLEKSQLPREKRAVLRAKILLGDKAEKSPDAPQTSAKDKRTADKIAEAVERQALRDETQESGARRRRKNDRGDTGKYLAFGAAGLVGGAILAGASDDDRKRALAGLPFVFLARGRLPLIGRLPAAEKAAAAEWAKTPLHRGPLDPHAAHDAKMAFNGEPGPRNMEKIIDSLFPEIGAGEDRVFRPVEQPKARRVQFVDVEKGDESQGREFEFRGSVHGDTRPIEQPNIVVRKALSASHALTQFGVEGEALNRGVNFVEQAVNTTVGRTTFDYKAAIYDATERAGFKDDFTKPMSKSETRDLQKLWESVVDGNPISIEAGTKVRVIADWAARMTMGRRVPGLSAQEQIVSDALTKQWSDLVALKEMEASEAMPKWVPMPNYGLPVVIAPEALGPSHTTIGPLGIKAWQAQHEEAVRLQERIISEAIAARPNLDPQAVFDHLSGMRSLSDDPLNNYSILSPDASRANFLDRHRLLDVLSGRILDPAMLFDRYVPSIQRRIEHARFWGADAELARDILDVARANRKNIDAMGALFDIASNQAPKNSSQFLDNVSGMVSIRSLGRGGIRQLSTWANGLKYPVRYRDGLRAYNDAFRAFVAESHMSKSVRDKFYNAEHALFIHEMGSAMRNEYNNVTASLSGIIGKATHMVLKYPYLVSPLDRIPRLQSAMWARRTIHALVPEIEHAIQSGKTTRFGIQDYYSHVARELWQDPAVQRIALKATHTDAEIEALKINAAEWLVARTNGRSEPRDMPALMAHPLGKQLYKFQQFNLRQTAEAHRQWAITNKGSTINNPAARLKLIAGTMASLGVGYGVMRLVMASRRQDKDDPIAKQAAETLAGASMYPMVFSAYSLLSGEYGPLGERGLGASYGAIAEATSAPFMDIRNRRTNATRSMLINNMPEPFWGPWIGVPTRKELREKEKERRKDERARDKAGY